MVVEKNRTTGVDFDINLVGTIYVCGIFFLSTANAQDELWSESIYVFFYGINHCTTIIFRVITSRRKTIKLNASRSRGDINLVDSMHCIAVVMAAKCFLAYLTEVYTIDTSP